jgi:hypothetical protein
MEVIILTGLKFRVIDINLATPMRTVRPQVRVTWQLFTKDKEAFQEPIEADVPNEISLAQLVANFIVPFMEGRFDHNTMFNWRLEERVDKSKKDKTKHEIIQIPQILPPRSNFRVKENSVGSDKKLAHLNFGSIHLHLAMPKGATLANLSAFVAATMQQSDQGNQWYVEGNPREAVDFDFCYPIVPVPAPQEADIFLKQAKFRVRLTEPWMNVSDRLISGLRLPRGINK